MMENTNNTFSESTNNQETGLQTAIVFNTKEGNTETVTTGGNPITGGFETIIKHDIKPFDSEYEIENHKETRKVTQNPNIINRDKPNHFDNEYA